ncbi:hypothetical protein GPA27_19450 [Aromatoleum toluolicum]|uniref:Uncharacterized protein n=1 Tax=Aromatoleum toluolicum TaxID=90060 RepID=A0ABX1NJR0_9RHOO|nr:hypothetical protein [Aromatoleum toluolicum]NMF99557.1 hypothetical protein [Aromatoleum toluolicum]
MSAFITLGNAARLLAAEGDGSDDVALWLSLLESHADDLRAVRTWIDRTHTALPGGISYWRSPDQWQIPRALFLAWCDKHGFQPHRDEEGIPSTRDTTPHGGADRRGKQIAVILEAIGRRGWNAMRIPTGGKGEIKSDCLTDARLFTKSGFDRAWQAAINAGHLRMENHDTYARR